MARNEREITDRQVKSSTIYVIPNILWGDEIFGRHALSSRGWG